MFIAFQTALSKQRAHHNIYRYWTIQYFSFGMPPALTINTNYSQTQHIYTKKKKKQEEKDITLSPEQKSVPRGKIYRKKTPKLLKYQSEFLNK